VDPEQYPFAESMRRDPPQDGIPKAFSLAIVESFVLDKVVLLNQFFVKSEFRIGS
jgi:hypothetical protein